MQDVTGTDDLVPVGDSRQATAALEALDAAIAATAWMETLASLDGDYPSLDPVECRSRTP